VQAVAAIIDPSHLGRDFGRAVAGMLTFGIVAALFLAWLGIKGQWTGPLLWPAVAAHAAISGALGGLWLREMRVKGIAPKQ